MDRREFFYRSFLSHFGYEPTTCQDAFLGDVAAFLTEDNGDILVANGYAGTGKTTALAAIVATMGEMEIPCVLLAPTGRAAKVLSSYTGRPAYTIHKHIYRRQSISGDGFGQFSLSPNKAKDTLYIVDEVSLIGIDGGSSGAAFGTGNLLEDLVSYVRHGIGCRMILVGDAAQLPPVGLDASPALSEDFMDQFGGVLFSTLTTVVRQQNASGILHNATLVRYRITGDVPGCTDATLAPKNASSLRGPGPLRCGNARSGLASAQPDQGRLQLELKGFEDIERIGGGELIDAISDAYDRFGEDNVIVLTRSNKRANRYNAGIRAMVQFKEERLVRGEKLMIVKNCYQFASDKKDSSLEYIANGDIAKLLKISRYEDRYGLHFATARLSFPDYGDEEIVAKVCLDTLESESASLTREQQEALYQGVLEDYAHLTSKKKRYDAVKEDPYFNALQLKYANAITGHKSQGGQWDCVFIDNPFWQDDLGDEDLKWLYTALTRAVKKVYLVNFKDSMFVL